MTRAQLLPEILKLDASDQLLIAEAIRSNLAGQHTTVDEVEFKRELDQRVADADANPKDQSSLEDVLRRLRAKR